MKIMNQLKYFGLLSLVGAALTTLFISDPNASPAMLGCLSAIALMFVSLGIVGVFVEPTIRSMAGVLEKESKA